MRVLGLAVLGIALAGCAASTAYRRGAKEVQREEWDSAVMNYSKALALAARLRGIPARPNLPTTALAGGTVRLRPAISDRISTAAGAALWVFLSALSLAGAPAAASPLFSRRTLCMFIRPARPNPSWSFYSVFAADLSGIGRLSQPMFASGPMATPRS